MIVKKKLSLYKIFCTLKKIPPPVVASYEKNLKITKENKIVKNTNREIKCNWWIRCDCAK